MMPKYVTKIECDKAAGYMVRIPTDRIEDGKRKLHHKFFSLSHCLSWEDCLYQAEGYRDKKLSELWPEQWASMLTTQCYSKLDDFSERARIGKSGPDRKALPANKTGVIGVSVYVKRNKPGYIGMFYAKGKVKRSGYSSYKWGTERAFTNACIFRAKVAGELVICNPTALPVPKEQLLALLKQEVPDATFLVKG